MEAALDLGERSLGLAAPNPSVGAILVKDGAAVGRAATAPGGRPHAEPLAIAQAGEAARGANPLCDARTLLAYRGLASLRGRGHRGRRRPGRIGDRGPESQGGGEGARPAAGGGDQGRYRYGGGSGATRPSRPYSPRHAGPSVRDAETRRDGGRLCFGRPARSAPAHHRADRQSQGADHARDPRCDHGRRGDRACRRSRPHRPSAGPGSEAACASCSTRICAYPRDSRLATVRARSAHSVVAGPDAPGEAAEVLTDLGVSVERVGLDAGGHVDLRRRSPFSARATSPACSAKAVRASPPG